MKKPRTSEEFWDHVARARRRVSRWPKWKRDVVIGPKPRGEI